MDVAATAPASETRSSTVRERAAAAPAERGALIGRYVVLGRVGEGAMGAVYAAYDPELDRRVALKLLHPEVSATAERVERLLREGRALGRLAHPDIVAVHDVGRHAERVFIVLEFVEGHTLGQWMREAPRSWREVLRVFARAGQGLAAAHAAGLVHRDFKPDNVLLGVDGRVRVADFGLASVAEPGANAPARPPIAADPDERSLDATGALVGTPAYMAPEQLAGGAADARSDQYAFCVALYEALYGRRPFRAATVGELAATVAREPATAPAAGDVPPWLRDLVLRGLRANPAERFPSMGALLAAIPVDPEADSRISDGARAVLVAGFVAVQSLVVSSSDPRDEAQWRAFSTGRHFALWIVATLVVMGLVLLVFRRRLLANRSSRQLFASLAVIYYASAFAWFLGARFGANAATISAFSFPWLGACLLLLGITLRPIFLAFAAIPLVAAGVLVAHPEHAGVLERVIVPLITIAMALAWGLGPRYSAWRAGRRP